MNSLLTVKDLKVHFPIRAGFFNSVVDHIRAVDGIDLEIEKGKTYGLIGESGSGKSTIGKAIMGLEKKTAGQIIYEGKEINTNRINRKSNYRRDVQMIFQDSLSSLNPKKKIYDILAEPIRNFQNLTKDAEHKRIVELLEIVGMTPENIYKYAHEFSGGQRQRIGIARAIANNPKIIIADEPVSALDLSVQAQVLNYMKKIQNLYGLSFIFISHDLGVVRHMCDYMYIMYRGRFVETGDKNEIYKNPQHIYTKRLIKSIPSLDPLKKEENIKARIEIEAEYTQKEELYYDKNGRVKDLIKLKDSKNHYVALDKSILKEGGM